MKVLVIGSGGREHTICWKFAQSKKVEKVYCAPGNGGTSLVAQNIDIKVNDFEKLSSFMIDNKIDFAFVGPEVPLAGGITDYFNAKGLKIIGPSQKGAMLEASKKFSKEFMKKYNIPTANYQTFSSYDKALEYLNTCPENKKIVIKADGLAAGKGVYMCSGRKDACDAVNQLMNEKTLGNAGLTIVAEEYIDGPELSYLIFTDGISYSMMPASQDHKRINDNDEGLNTGGMGAYAPAPLATKELNKKVEENIVKKVMTAIKAENMDYKGVLYVGVIMNGQEPYVLEFNCRFGDPETQVVLPLLKTDLIDVCLAILNQKLSQIKIEWDDKFAICVVLSSHGYPGKCQTGYEIKGLQNLSKETIVFHAGTKSENGKLLTSGGRVLAVSTKANSVKEAIQKVYEEVKLVSFEGMHYRKDIARRALND